MRIESDKCWIEGVAVHKAADGHRMAWIEVRSQHGISASMLTEDQVLIDEAIALSVRPPKMLRLVIEELPS